MKAQSVNNDKLLFEEIQRWTNPFLWLVVIGTFLLILGILLYQVFTGNRVGTKPAPNIALIAMLLLFLGPGLVLFYISRLKTKIDSEFIYYGWNIPTEELNKIRLSDIVSCEIIEYSFVGYGLRLSRKYGTVYNVKGNKGLQIITKAGDKILIGTQKEKELKEALMHLNFHN